jgi:hypothetical protein
MGDMTNTEMQLNESTKCRVVIEKNMQRKLQQTNREICDKEIELSELVPNESQHYCFLLHVDLKCFDLN